VLVERALYLAGIKGYQTPGGEERWKVPSALWYSGRREVRPDVVMDITPVIEAKRAAINAHKSQFMREPGSAETPLNSPDFLDAVEARARVAGIRIGVRFAEAFALVGSLGVKDLRAFGGGGS
jgi:LmbE family N-acetylglucosaminyl deacetylase